ncbi:MAG: hypothetical protein AVDCRST_MAG77-5540 [uncultured Chloroflexi bacterium]|uniref:Uncharacterized protein n=1 Tax=uncultured Chloroflexota bacterium TaxID=166587 RepID=A0A6J4KBF1_9CHLR|nr:MAG: hypothetical protein AVDCRST_MAG77-5540 [uncultured Chloroflexota bacterium]
MIRGSATEIIVEFSGASIVPRAIIAISQGSEITATGGAAPAVGMTEVTMPVLLPRNVFNSWKQCITRCGALPAWRRAARHHLPYPAPPRPVMREFRSVFLTASLHTA